MVLSLCMIVKDEEKNLRGCLESVKNIADEIIIVDTGSSDGTEEIAKSYGADVFHFAWTGSFSEARNFSLRQAKGDWIMIMDADEELGEYEPGEIRKLMDENADAYFFETVSYIGDEPGIDAVRSMNLRLLKNNKGYFYIHTVHEQVYSVILALNPRAKIVNKDYIVYHYGYLTKNIIEKDKRSRNIALLKKQLEESPGNSFALYNLGSEYCALDETEKALEYFEQAYAGFNPDEGFSPVMIFKMISCYALLGRYEEALRLCGKGLVCYPRFTDLEYMKGVIQKERGNISLAAAHFKMCADMGEAPGNLNVIIGTGTFRPLFARGEILYERGDYAAAAECFERSLRLSPSFKDAADMLDKARAGINAQVCETRGRGECPE